MYDPVSIIKRAADKTNFTRVRYVEKDIPTSIENVVLMPFFGDMRSIFIFSSLILRRIKEEAKASKYFILASWPGYESLFPYVDEYWSIADEGTAEKLMAHTKEFENNSTTYTVLRKEFNNWFYEILDPSVIKSYYSNGITQEYFDRFGHVKVSLPDVPSAASLGPEFVTAMGKRPGNKVLIYPTKQVYSWRVGKSERIRIGKEFWLALAERLKEEGWIPVIYKDAATYDISAETTDAIHIREKSIFKVLGAMRTVGCVLDMFSGISRLAIAAKTPFIMVDERQRYVGTKEYEIDDLCAQKLPREYIFGFTTIIEHGNKTDWNRNLFDNIIIRLNSFVPSLDRDSWPSTAASNDTVSYANVRKTKNKRLGTKFVRIPKD